MCESNHMRCGSPLWPGPMAGIDVMTSLHAAVLTPVVCRKLLRSCARHDTMQPGRSPCCFGGMAWACVRLSSASLGPSLFCSYELNIADRRCCWVRRSLCSLSLSLSFWFRYISFWMSLHSTSPWMLCVYRGEVLSDLCIDNKVLEYDSGISPGHGGWGPLFYKDRYVH